ncbi:uncharacterized protein JCM6883_006628 [Sporobolomyces salmoneus]|uniref:uncharacterized protein n=1 Tax=Sporobolomyces salmoneus TaxID=183962 RepID=UPI00317B85AA
MSRNPNQGLHGPSYNHPASYEPDPSNFNSTSYPAESTGGAGGAGGYPSRSRSTAVPSPGGGGVNRRQTVRGAVRGTVRDVNENPRASMMPQRGLTRGKTLTRPDRFVAPAPLINPTGPGKAGKQGGAVKTELVNGVPTLTTKEPWWEPWSLFVEISTFWAPRWLLRKFGMTDPTKQRAWKEKCALCEISMLMMGIIGFITIGLNRTLCPTDGPRSQSAYTRVGSTQGLIGIEGWNFQVSDPTPTSLSIPANSYGGTDETPLFDRSGYRFPACEGIRSPYATVNLCTSPTQGNASSCVLRQPTENYLTSQLHLTNTTKRVGYDWNQLSNFTNFLVIDGIVLNLTPYINAHPTPLNNDTVDAAIRYMLNGIDQSGGKDATRLFYNDDGLKDSVDCLVQRYQAGHIDKVTPGCFVSNLFLYISLILIMGIVLARFAMACIFSWILAARMVKPPKNLKRNVISPAVLPEGANIDVDNTTGAAPWTEAAVKRQQTRRLQKNATRKGRAAGGGGDPEKPLPRSHSDAGHELDGALPVNPDGMISMASIGAELFCVCLVTCYSEGAEGIKTTLDSIAGTTYSDARKLMFIVCDGMITGSGEKMSTPDICVGMIERDPRFGDPTPMSYVAVADGSKAHNQAMVYAGHYTGVPGHRTPIVVVVKCGPPSEAREKKPGNRGKRDSQMILMNFFSRVTYNDRMCPLDYDLFRKTQSLMGVTPDFFEVCLMVDADTMCYPEALGYLVRTMQNDNMIMGVCGETRIANKRQSWVTMIQVFEYFISHHLAKAFESVFGGVTCLPGCFSMYRIKARKQDDGDWFPVLVQPSIISEYSQSVVTTLHQKNLLLLGEDRFLTTLLLRTFPNRKMMFCPYARCRTVAPDTFSVLLSQRRRWINSTIHNLMELVLVRNLCGTFCFSMQFIVFIDLVGTIVLPIAICLTYTLVITYIFNPPSSFGDAIPLVLLAGVLGLPGILIVLTTFKIVYVGWMLVYLIALPIWNFVLPVYAFSKFDDFSWGETRKVAGEIKSKDDHSAGGGVAIEVPLRRWEDWERSRLRKFKREEKRKREFEHQFGSRAVHAAPSTRDGLSTYAESETASSYGGGDDQWGAHLGNYHEESGNFRPPPPGLFAVDEMSEDAETLDQHDLDIVLDQGWEESPPQSRGGFGSGYSTPSEQQHGQFPSSHSHSRPAPPPKLYSLSDAPLMQHSLSSSSHLTSTMSLNSPSSPNLPNDPFQDRAPSPLISVESAGGGNYSRLDESIGAASNGSSTSSAIEPLHGGHARQRSLSTSPTAAFNPAYQSSNSTSPTRSRNGYDYDNSSSNRRLV